MNRIFQEVSVQKSLALGCYALQTVVPSYGSKSLTMYDCDVQWLLTQKNKLIQLNQDMFSVAN